MIIAIDFDGTLVTHEYPKIGLEVDDSVRVVKALRARGHQIILYTMRDGDRLDEAVEYCKSVGIELWQINQNIEQYTWTNSPKVYAHVYIDDAALGCPLIFPQAGSGKRPWADWNGIEALLIRRSIL